MNLSIKNEIEFFDGETIKDKYFLLGNSKNYLLDLNGIKYTKAVKFLFDEGKVNNYFFRIDYDINMIFKDLEIDLLKKLFNNIEIKITINGLDFYIIYFRHKILVIKNKDKTKYYYDIFNFFNKSFIEVLKIFQLDKKYKKEYNFIVKYKGLRDKFTKKDLENIIKYNFYECLLGIELTDNIYNLLPNDLKTFKLYGPSSITNIYLLKNEIDKKINKIKNLKILKSMFYGGRMEAFKVGKFIDVYKYDINSAYPSVINNLKVIERIEKNNNLNEIIETDIYKVKLEILNDSFIGLLPVRLKNNIVIYPSKVQGWYFGVEVKACYIYSKKYPFIKIKILKRYKVYFKDEKLFNDIELLYNKRIELKERNDLRHYVYKILLNSIYGKFSQKVGNNIFNNYYYAGFITSSIRAKILVDFIDYAKDIIFIATDGVLLNCKNSNINISKKLGEYEEIKIKRGYVIMSGIYYLIDYNNKIYKGERGFRFNFEEIIPVINEQGYTYINNKVFITNLFAIKNYKNFKNKRCKIIDFSKKIDIKNQIKRKFIFNINKYFLENQFDSLILNEKDIKAINNIQLELLDNYIDFIY